jgi:hypothetical protein
MKYELRVRHGELYAVESEWVETYKSIREQWYNLNYSPEKIDLKKAAYVHKSLGALMCRTVSGEIVILPVPTSQNLSFVRLVGVNKKE